MTKTPAKSGRAPTDAEFAALRGNDATADGRFFYAVATTGVFCKPSCVSRVPKRENVRIFADAAAAEAARSEEHTSALQSLMRLSYAVFCLKKKTKQAAQSE